MSYCKIILMGRLTRDVDLKQTPNGSNIAQVGIAFDTGYGDYKKSNFAEIKSWGKQGEFLANYFSKGDPIFIDGRLDLEQWVDKNTGKNRQRLVIISERLDFCLGPNSSSNNGPQQKPPELSSPPMTKSNSEPPWGGGDDYIPF